MICKKIFHPVYTPMIPEGIHVEDITFSNVMSSIICPSCSKVFMSSLHVTVCSKCGIIIDDYKGEDHICMNCMMFPPVFNMARSFGSYDDILGYIIRRYKYNYKTTLAKPLGILLFRTFIHYWQPNDIDLIMPVPLHITRFRERGFNQVYLLIKQWVNIAKKLNIDTPIRVERDVLERIRATKPQVQMKGKERRENIRNAFAVADPSKIKGKKILLIDDVLTTGATVDECTRTLLSSGARQVDVLTLARVINSPNPIF